MVMKILKFSRFQQEPVKGQRALLTIKFLDDDGNLYSWAPRWDDLERAFLRALNVEAFNKPESEWLNRFANTVRDVSEGVSQPIQDARKFSGNLYALQDGMLQMSYSPYSSDGYNEFTESVPPGFAITYEFLEEWLHRDIEALIINGVVVSIKDRQNHYIEYPPKAAPDSTFD